MMNNECPVGYDEAVKFILREKTLSDRDFERINEIVYRLSHIDIRSGKKELVQARLNKRLLSLGLSTYKQYVDYLNNDPRGDEYQALVDALTTNTTSFFRENSHFDYLTHEVLRKLDSCSDRRLRIWSAGCSTGEEAFSIAITVLENLQNINAFDVKILATDISSKVLDVARRGIYKESNIKGIPQHLKDKYFTPLHDNDREVSHAVRPDLARMILFRQLNLMGTWPMRHRLDMIFCRNVMIYFDKETRIKLVEKFFHALRPGGIFIIGHSESLAGLNRGFLFEQPSIYKKPCQNDEAKSIS